MDEFVKLKDTGLYYKKLDCLETLFEAFARRHGFPFPDLKRTFLGSDEMYFTVNAEDNSIKFVVHSEEGDNVVMEWKDPEIVNTFMAFHQLYTYYSESQDSQS